MSVGTLETTKYEANGDGSTTVFATGLVAATADELIVLITDEDGAVTTQTAGVDYTFATSGGLGVVTFDTAPAATDIISFVRNTTITQTLDLTYNERQPSIATEAAFDRIVRMVRDIDQRPVLRFPDSEPLTHTYTLGHAADRAGKVLAFHATSGEMELITKGSLVEDITPADIGAEVAGAAAAAQAASTAYVDAALVYKAPLASPGFTGTPTVPTAAPGTSTTQAASTAFVQAAVAGVPVTTESILDKLKGAAADATRIGTEFMPEAVTVDSISVGEVPSAVLALGTLTRVGTELRIHDGVGTPLSGTPGGVPIAVPAGNPYRFTGYKKTIPFGTGGSTVKNIGTFYYDEIGRVKLPVAEVVNGAILHLYAWSRIITNVAGVLLTNRNFYLVPVTYWDTDPIASSFNTTTVVSIFANWRPLGANSLETECIRSQAMTISWDGATFSSAFITGGATIRGYDETAVARYTDVVISGIGAYAPTAGEDLEFVIVGETTSAETRSVHMDLALSVCAP